MKVIVSSSRRYWALGRCFEAGDSDPFEADEAQLAQLDAAKGGVKIEQCGLERATPEQRSPPVLTYRIVQDPPAPPPAPEPLPAPELAITAGPTETPHEIPGEESPHDGA
jgi:hypothetical protein